MPIVPILISGLASSVVSLFISHYTQQPAITINGTATAKEEAELNLWKLAFFGAVGVVVVKMLKR